MKQKGKAFEEDGHQAKVRGLYCACRAWNRAGEGHGHQRSARRQEDLLQDKNPRLDLLAVDRELQFKQGSRSMRAIHLQQGAEYDQSQTDQAQ